LRVAVNARSSGATFARGPGARSLQLQRAAADPK